MAQLKAEYNERLQSRRLPEGTSFEEFYGYWRSGRRGEKLVGLDDGALEQRPRQDNVQLISRPSRTLKGVIQTLVLLVDFEDLPHNSSRTPAFYEQMLFGDEGVFLTGSMREYYRRLSGYSSATDSGLDIQGKVFGWFRLPHPRLTAIA